MYERGWEINEIFQLNVLRIPRIYPWGGSKIALEDAEWSCLAGDAAAIAPEHIARAIRALVYEIATDGALEEKVSPNIMGTPLPQD